MKALTRPHARRGKNLQAGAPRPERPDLAHVKSDELLETISVVERPITSQLVRGMQRWVKRHWGWSAADLAERLCCSRPHLKRIESGSRQPSEMFEVHFRHLESQRAAWLVEHRAEERERPLVVITKKALPTKRLSIMRPVVRCTTRGCGIWFEQVNSRHRKCCKECRPPKRIRRRKAK